MKTLPSIKGHSWLARWLQTGWLTGVSEWPQQAEKPLPHFWA